MAFTWRHQKASLTTNGHMKKKIRWTKIDADSLSFHSYHIEYLISDKKRIIEMLKTTVVFEFSIFVNMERYSFGIIRFILFGFCLTYQSLSVCWAIIAVVCCCWNRIFIFQFFFLCFFFFSRSFFVLFNLFPYPNLFVRLFFGDIYPAKQMTTRSK